ncbi:MAG: TVP38/TMEM64 family protein [Woeseiaceae bacterium]
MNRTIFNRSNANRVVITAIFLALAYSLYNLPFAAWIGVVVDWSKLHPVAGPLIYVSCVILATVAFVPGSGSMMIAGFLFGLLPGFLYAALAISVGAQCAFVAGRMGARHWVEAKVAANPRMQAIESGLREEAFLIVALTRLSLVIPFNILNYAYGVTSVTARTHFFATALGMLPAVGLYVYLGTLARDIGQILSGEATPSDLGYWIAAAGVTAIVVLTWAIHRVASRALARHVPALEVDDAE